jgi:hypothetical protein
MVVTVPIQRPFELFIIACLWLGRLAASCSTMGPVDTVKLNGNPFHRKELRSANPRKVVSYNMLQQLQPHQKYLSIVGVELDSCWFNLLDDPGR